MKKLILLLTFLLSFILVKTSVLAQSNFVIDNASIFSSSTDNSLNNTINSLYNFNRKEIVVYTTPSLNGQNIDTVSGSYFQSKAINGVLIYISKGDSSLAIKTGSQTRNYFTISQQDSVKNQLLTDFHNKNFDAGITSAVNSIVNDLYQYNPSSNSNTASVQAGNQNNSTPISGIFIWILVIAGVFIIFKVITSLFRGPSTPYSPGYSQPLTGSPMGMGGGFLTSLLGSFGGSIIGNSVFDWFSGRNDIVNGQNTNNYNPPSNFSNDNGNLSNDNGNDSGSWDNSSSDTGSSDSGSW